MIINTIDKIEIEYAYMLEASHQLTVRIYYNNGSKFERSILDAGLSTQFLQLMFAIYYIFDKTNLQDVYYEILDRMHCTGSKENFSIFVIQLLTKTTIDHIVTQVAQDYKELLENLDLHWDDIDVNKLKNYTIIHIHSE